MNTDTAYDIIHRLFPDDPVAKPHPDAGYSDLEPYDMRLPEDRRWAHLARMSPALKFRFLEISALIDGPHVRHAMDRLGLKEGGVL